jgi:hypothetical protein
VGFVAQLLFCFDAKSFAALDTSFIQKNLEHSLGCLHDTISRNDLLWSDARQSSHCLWIRLVSVVSEVSDFPTIILKLPCHTSILILLIKLIPRRIRMER